MIRAATLATCPRCGSVGWHGYDSDHAALRVLVELTPIRATAEAWALLGGWATYNLLAVGSGRVVRHIVHRSHWHIAGKGGLGNVHLGHRCGIAIPPAWLAIVESVNDSSMADPEGIPF